MVTIPGLQAEPLFSEALTPLCSPGLLKRKGVLKRFDELRKHRIIHATSIPGGEQRAWERWLALAGAKHISTQRGSRFTLAELALQAAIDGAGVVLGRIVLAEGFRTVEGNDWRPQRGKGAGRAIGLGAPRALKRSGGLDHFARGHLLAQISRG